MTDDKLTIRINIVTAAIRDRPPNPRQRGILFVLDPLIFFCALKSSLIPIFLRDHPEAFKFGVARVSLPFLASIRGSIMSWLSAIRAVSPNKLVQKPGAESVL
jgi:hypothetical protein